MADEEQLKMEKGNSRKHTTLREIIRAQRPAPLFSTMPFTSLPGWLLRVLPVPGLPWPR